MDLSYNNVSLTISSSAVNKCIIPRQDVNNGGNRVCGEGGWGIQELSVPSM